MSESQKKETSNPKSTKQRSPNAPSFSLGKALEFADQIYNEEKRNTASADAVSKDLGYSSYNNGTARAVIATLKYYGILEKVEKNSLVVSQSFENYKFAPSESEKKRILSSFLKAPKVFQELLEKFPKSLPSQNNLQYHLLQLNFTAETAGETAQTFIESVGLVDFYSNVVSFEDKAHGEDEINEGDEVKLEEAPSDKVKSSTHDTFQGNNEVGFDAVTVFLPKGKKAVLHLKRPFTEQDKEALKKQVEAMWVDDEDDFTA